MNHEYLDEILRQQRKYTEKTIADIITSCDFMVGSIECAYKLKEILPKDCKVICTPYINNPSMIYAIKRYDLNDLLYIHNEINVDNWFYKRFTERK